MKSPNGSSKIIKAKLKNTLKRHRRSAVIMLELPAEDYFKTSTSAVKYLIDNDFNGVYVSFQRPYSNVSTRLHKEGVNVKKMKFIDVASSLAEEKKLSGENFIHLSSEVDIDELVRGIYTSLYRLKSNKLFIFIDSLSTITLYKPLSEIMRFSEFLMHTVRKPKDEKVLLFLVFNVSKELTERKFIQDIAFQVDELLTV